MTEEHLWAEWMHPYLPTLPDAQKEEVYRIARNRRTVLTHNKIQQGQVYTKRLKVVCKKCNNTWMSGIEERVKPILIPLIQGVPITLTEEYKVKLARWIVLKVMAAECENSSDAVLAQESRTEFMDTLVIPRGMKIWISNHDSESWYTGYWHQTLTATLTRRPPITGGHKNIQTTAFGVGHMFSLAFVTTLEGFDCEPNVESLGIGRQLWPLRRRNIVRPLPILSESDVDRLATSIRELLASPNVEWRPLPK